MIVDTQQWAQLMKIAHYYGKEKQLCKLIEELGEAVSAASELQMVQTYQEYGGKSADLTARQKHLAEELADVQNVMDQVIALFDLEADFKAAQQAGICKTLNRIAEDERAQKGENITNQEAIKGLQNIIEY